MPDSAANVRIVSQDRQSRRRGALPVATSNCAGDCHEHEDDRSNTHAAHDTPPRLAPIGAGLIAFGALERLGESGRVIFSDVSQDLLDHAFALAEEGGVLDRCEFALARAEDLAPIADESVDVVTTRSVIIYVPRELKPLAFEEFFRVLRAGGMPDDWSAFLRLAGNPCAPTLEEALEGP